MEIATPGTQVITLTDKAAAQVQSMIEERELENASLRVFIAGSGCSGLQYGMALDLEQREDDQEFRNGDVRLVIDPVSLQYMSGSTIDYVEHEYGAGFQIDNPNAQPSAGADGCGTCSGCG